MGMRWLLKALLLSTVVCCGDRAFAQTAGTKKVDEVKVSGNRTSPPDFSLEIVKVPAPLADIPRSIQIIPRTLLDEQGITNLAQAISNVSGASQGGQFAFGFYDRLQIRGLNVNHLTDGLPDETSELGGIPHSLTGVERVEVLKGPGSALYGGGQQGASVNLVHFRPADAFAATAAVQYGSFDTVEATAGVTGPTSLANVDFRIDADYQDTDGLRRQKGEGVEILPALSWRPNDHDVELRVEYRNLKKTPDAAGIPFSPPSATGKPAPVSYTNTYFTPFARGDQEIARLLLSDAWQVNENFVLNNRASLTHRTVDILRNAGGSLVLLNGQYALRGRQLRRQTDDIDDLLYQTEANWRFNTGALGHHLLAGLQAQWVNVRTMRSTADLPNIDNIATPVIAEQSLAALTFRCDATHSCADADLNGRFYGLYVADQIDVTKAWKIRLSARQDWFNTKGEARSAIPVNPGMSQPCNPPRIGVLCPWLPGVPVRRDDQPISWDVGTVYYIIPEFSVFAGASNSHYPIFNTEEPESTGGRPEGGTQYEAGARLAVGPKLSVSSAVYQVERDSIFTVLVDPQTGLDVATTFGYRVRGWEFDLHATPIVGWTIDANYSHQSPKISDYPQSPLNVGHLVPSVPQTLANLWTSYAIPVSADSTVTLKAGVRYRNRAFADANNTRILPGSLLVDAGVAWSVRRLELSAGVNNVADRRSWLYGAGTGGGAVPGPGRTAYGRIAVKFN
jgi:iron complex outermembrane recepter protein